MRHKEDSVRSSPHRTAEAGLDDSRGHTVHSYVTVSQLGGQGPGETQQRRLTHTVRTEALSATHTINVISIAYRQPVDISFTMLFY